MNETLTRQLLEWIAAAPRSYGETMETWRTSCPRLAIWEDALAEGLVEVMSTPQGQVVTLSDEGRRRIEI